MKTIYKIIGGIAIVLVAGFAGTIGKSVGRSTAEREIALKSESSIEETLIKKSAEINKKLPLTLNKDTKIESTHAGPGKRFTYNYTLVKYKSDEISKRKFKDIYSPKVLAETCSNPEMGWLFKNNVQLVYRYSGVDGKIVGDIIVNPSDCGY